MLARQPDAGETILVPKYHSLFDRLQLPHVAIFELAYRNLFISCSIARKSRHFHM